jgi:hypothetical protein
MAVTIEELELKKSKLNEQMRCSSRRPTRKTVAT